VTRARTQTSRSAVRPDENALGRRCALNAMVRRSVSSGASRHPRKALLISVFAIRHRKALLAVTHATERAARSASTARRVAGNPKVHKETRLAVSAMAQARERALEVGFVRAPSDKQLAAHLRRAGRHASKAMMLAERARRNRRFGRRTVTVVTGAGVLGGAAAYAGWKAYGRPQCGDWSSGSSPRDGEPSADSAPPAAP
jgi:hypothetical protein